MRRFKDIFEEIFEAASRTSSGRNRNQPPDHDMVASALKWSRRFVWGCKK